MPRLYSVFIGSNHPIDSFAWGPMLMDLEYSDNHRKGHIVYSHYVQH